MTANSSMLAMIRKLSPQCAQITISIQFTRLSRRTLREQPQIDESECFIDATFASAKGGVEEIGPTRRGKGVKIMAIVDRHGLPLAVSTHTANHHEVTLVQLSFELYKIEAGILDPAKVTRRAAWAEWAGWICKERERSLLSDAQRRVDRRPPSGSRRGFFRLMLLSSSFGRHSSEVDSVGVIAPACSRSTRQGRSQEMWHCGAVGCAMHGNADQRCAKWRMAPVIRSVGRGTVNEWNDVKIIQGALNRVLPSSGGPAPKLRTDGVCGSKTIAAIEKLQSRNFSWKADGIIEPNKSTIGKLAELALVGGAAAVVGQSASGGEFSFPLDKAPSPDWNGGKRYFGAPRSNGRLHGGCDILGPPGTPIYAISDGVLVRGPYQFTGPKQKLAVTDAVEIRHGQYLIRYGEIAPGSFVGGKTVTKGSVIAKIGALRMLHFEMYSNGASTESLTGTNKYKRRADVMNPAPLLDQWVKNLPGK